MNKDSRTVYLDGLRTADSETLYSWINDRNVVIFNNNYKPVHEPNHNQWFEGIVKRNDVQIFAIRTVEHNELIGTCQLYNINSINRSAELQIRIGNAGNRGKGYGKQAVDLLLSFGFSDLNLSRIYLHVFEDNKAAIRLYEKCNFKKEGLLREADYIDGEFKNVLIMSVLKKEFSGNE